MEYVLIDSKCTRKSYVENGSCVKEMWNASCLLFFTLLYSNSVFSNGYINSVLGTGKRKLKKTSQAFICREFWKRV